MNEMALPEVVVSEPSPGIRDMLRVIPRECLVKHELRAFAYLLIDFSLAAILVAVMLNMSANYWPLEIVPSILLGVVLTGLFTIGHDAGHRAFSKSRVVENLVGHVTTSLVLWPFHVWRISHNFHHRHTHHVDLEIAWRPATMECYRGWSPWQRQGYLLSRTWFFFIASAFFTVLKIAQHFTGQGLSRREHRQVLGSMVVTAVIWSGYGFGCFWFGGLRGLIFIFLIPQLVFYTCLSLITYLQHSAPDILFLSSEEWTDSRARLGSSIHVNYPKLFDWLTHSIAWHVPHHVCPAIPHYHLKKAHEAIREAYPNLVFERTFSMSYLLSVLDQCHAIEGCNRGEQDWIRLTGKGSRLV
jgi:omega-6 fatty acid desaturase (delta-12 desaturase)